MNVTIADSVAPISVCDKEDQLTDLSPARRRPPSFLDQAAAKFANKPFVPFRPFRNGDAQTIGAYLWPPRFRLRDLSDDEERLFQVDAENRVLARCRWHSDRRNHPTLILWHGIEGSLASAYMLTTAAKAFRAGFNAIRVNTRNCGATEHLTRTLYHGGMSGDVRAVVENLLESERLGNLYIVGFSLGGNVVMKLAGEWGENPPPEIKAIAAVSPSINLHASADLLMKRRNWVYHQDFLKRLKNRILVKAKMLPDVYNSTPLKTIRTIREFDEAYIAPLFGFANADDYYARSSSQPLIPHIRVPTLIVHAQDDPFVPFAPLRDALIAATPDDRSPVPSVSIARNPQILLLAPERGGHVAFMSRKTNDEDRFWAENRVIDFFEIERAG